jgi:hypothetical protein
VRVESVIPLPRERDTGGFLAKVSLDPIRPEANIWTNFKNPIGLDLNFGANSSRFHLDKRTGSGYLYPISGNLAEEQPSWKKADGNPAHLPRLIKMENE